MTFKFHCTHCGQRISAEDSTCGTTANCPTCGNIISIPLPPGASAPAPVHSQPLPPVAPITTKPSGNKPNSPKPGQSLGALFLIVVAGIALSQSEWFKSSSSSSSGAASGPPINVSADTLFSTYRANEVAADSKYKGKAVIVDGTVQDIAKDFLGSPYVIIGSSGVLSGVQCMFPKSDTSLGRLSKGQRITVRGEVNGKMVNVLLHNCSLQ